MIYQADVASLRAEVAVLATSEERIVGSAGRAREILCVNACQASVWGVTTMRMAMRFYGGVVTQRLGNISLDGP